MTSLTGRAATPSEPNVQNLPGSLADKISWAIERGQNRTAFSMLAAASLTVADYEGFHRFMKDAKSAQDADLPEPIIVAADYSDLERRVAGLRVDWTDEDGIDHHGKITGLGDAPATTASGKSLHADVKMSIIGFDRHVKVPVAWLNIDPWQTLFEETIYLGTGPDATLHELQVENRFLWAHNAALMDRRLYAEVQAEMTKSPDRPYSKTYAVRVRHDTYEWDRFHVA